MKIAQPRQVPHELQLDLPAFSGPIDLLLELIRKHELDIFDIPIALITTEYLAYVDAMPTLDLQTGGEWLEMAATLVHIKSKMLLPPDPTTEEEPDGPDPREELVQRLIEYQMYKLMAEKLDDRPQLARDVFAAPSRAAQYLLDVGPPTLREATIEDLVKALQRVIQRHENKPNWVYEITREKLTLRHLILEIAALLRDTPRLPFEALFENTELSRHRVVTTFLALLEMTRLKMIKLFQARLTEDVLYIERSVIDIVEISQSLELQ
ncbi:MAG: segregation/condensation protein A [Bradymonadaceae bacterium]|nr:segregation/condensation protein A [Lujinxingiaceae bacterium]